MPQELPGFYYDPDKNRYFPIKGPIPGSSSRKRKSSPQPSNSKPHQSSGPRKCSSIRSNELLQVREICGNMIASRKGKLNFRIEYEKWQASQPLIWKYRGTERMVDHALEQVRCDLNLPDGTTSADILLTGGYNGSLGLFEAGSLRQEFGHGGFCTPDRVWPSDVGHEVGPLELPRGVGRHAMVTLTMPSDISCIKVLPKQPVSADESSNILVTTLGSEARGGSVYNLHLRGPLDYSSLAWRRVHEITSLNRTIWTADCNSTGSQVVIGTNQGAIMVNLETGKKTSVCRCESDVLSLQVDQLGKIVLCGLRNGAILTLDARQKPEDYSARLARHRVSYPLSKGSSRRAGNFTKQWFELKGNMHPTRTIFMPSSISCLALLKLYDQYFCASSMDGSIKLYDHRLTQRGAIQSYEGNVNSHTRIQLGIDPAESFLMSGGEDCKLRLWKIKTGELLFEDKFMNSVPSVVCWPRTAGFQESQNEGQQHGESWRNNSSGAWLGSKDGLFYVDWPWNHV